MEGRPFISKSSVHSRRITVTVAFACVFLAAIAAGALGCGGGTGADVLDGMDAAVADGDLDAGSDVASENSGETGPPRAVTPDPWSGPLRLATIVDTNPDPRIIEVNLEARMADWEIMPGRTVRMMTYNGSVPGPLIEGRVGDTVIVHFRNSLAEPTTIHWHGVRVPVANDGTHHAMTPVAPGGTHDYRFELLDAGTFWYHPHVHTAFQVEQGLYGAIVVRGVTEPTVDREGVIVLDDLRLAMDGTIQPEQPADALPGREGPILLVNGRANVTLPIRAGATQRWRLINAANGRYFRLTLAGHSFAIIGSDVGLAERARMSDELFIVPGERMEVAFTGTAMPGTTGVVQTQPYNRGYGGGGRTALDVFRVEYVSDPAIVVRPLPDRLNTIARVNPDGVMPRTVRFGERFVMGQVEFTINGQAYPMVPVLRARIGQTEVWDILNETVGDHPFHLHGFSFQVVSRDGVPETEVIDRDTVNVRSRTTMRIAFRPERYPGMWMYHCHILEHADHGMIGDLEVLP